MKKDTRLVNAGRSHKHTGKLINPPVARASTIVFDSLADKTHSERNKYNNVENYGRTGTITTFAFKEAMCELEGAADCYVFPCGTAAITSSLLAFVSSGDHLLMVDSVYQPTRWFCDETLQRLGVEIEYYDPHVGAGIADLVRDNTALIFLESPGSLTMEVQDLPAIVTVARQHNIVTMIDNTYASPLNLKPLDLGIDISIHSATKYLAGHSDIMLGVASANEKTAPQLIERSHNLGQCASPDDIYTTLRGLRTLSVRMRQQADNGLIVAKWLAEHPLVDHVRHPALESCPGHQYYVRDYKGSNGLFSFVLKSTSNKALGAMINNMALFKMGYSWGGFESLILATTNFADIRTATVWQASGPLVRLSIGLEDVQDLIDDLATGLQRYEDEL